MNNYNRAVNNSGYSFLELVVAMAVAASVVVLVFTFMRTTDRGIRMQGSRIDRVNAMIITRKRVEAVVNRIQSIVSVSKNDVEFTIGNSDSIHSLTLRGDLLNADTAVIGKGIKNVKFEMDENSPRKNVFYWSAEFNNGSWIGGAKGFEKRR